MQEIVPNVWLGSMDEVDGPAKARRLQELGIDCVITVAEELRLSWRDEKLTYVQFFVDDSEMERVDYLFSTVNHLIDSFVDRNRGVLVHCAQGVVRSPTFVAAYLMDRHGMTVEEALGLLKQKRDMVAPNSGFIRQLHGWETILRIQGTCGWG